MELLFWLVIWGSIGIGVVIIVIYLINGFGPTPLGKSAGYHKDEKKVVDHSTSSHTARIVWTKDFLASNIGSALLVLLAVGIIALSVAWWFGYLQNLNIPGSASNQSIAPGWGPLGYWSLATWLTVMALIIFVYLVSQNIPTAAAVALGLFAVFALLPYYWPWSSTDTVEALRPPASKIAPPQSLAVTDECPGGPILYKADGYWVDVNKPRCRLVYRVKTVAKVQLRDSDGKVTRPIGPTDELFEPVTYVDIRAVEPGAEVWVALCPRSTFHIKHVGWDCKPRRT